MAKKSRKKHDCISAVRKDLMKQDKAITYVRFELSTITRLDGRGEVKTGQRIWIGIKKKRKTGEEYIKDERTFVTHDYCPFCGKKYK